MTSSEGSSPSLEYQVMLIRAESGDIEHEKAAVPLIGT